MTLWAILALCLVVHVFHGKQSWDQTLPPADLIAGLARACVGFPAGVLIYRAYRHGLLARLPSVNPRVVFAIWFLICMVPMGAHMAIFECLMAVLMAPLSVALLIRGEQPLPKLYAVLGALSYPLYASHFAIVNLATIWFAEPSGRNLPYVFPLLFAALFLAWGIDRLAAMLQTRRAVNSFRAAPAMPSP